MLLARRNVRCFSLLEEQLLPLFSVRRETFLVWCYLLHIMTVACCPVRIFGRIYYKYIATLCNQYCNSMKTVSVQFGLPRCLRRVLFTCSSSCYSLSSLAIAFYLVKTAWCFQRPLGIKYLFQFCICVMFYAWFLEKSNSNYGFYVAALWTSARAWSWCLWEGALWTSVWEGVWWLKKRKGNYIWEGLWEFGWMSVMWSLLSCTNPCSVMAGRSVSASVLCPATFTKDGGSYLQQ